MSGVRAPEGGAPPPAAESLPDGTTLELRRSPSASQSGTSPSTPTISSDGARAWCLHDTQFLLGWLVQEERLGVPIFAEQLKWLADLLRARGYPVEQLERHVELLAEEVAATVEGGETLAQRARSARLSAD